MLGILDSDPKKYFAVLTGLKSLVPLSDRGKSVPLLRSTEDRYYSPEFKNFEYKVLEEADAITASLGNDTIRVEIRG
jgi:hypothetical protein